MNERSNNINATCLVDSRMRVSNVIAILVIIAGFSVLSGLNFLLFHSLVELFSIGVAWSVFFLTWNAREHIRDDTLFLIGTSVFFASLLDLVHTLSYRGMGVFPNYDANLPTQLWIAARSLQALSLLAAVSLPRGSKSAKRVVSDSALAIGAGYVVATGFLLWVVFTERFPTCYIEGVGLTSFKRVSEYVISAVLILSVYLFWQMRERYTDNTRCLILVYIGATVVSELAFTFYVSVYGVSNVVGHVFKLAAYFALYLAIVRSGLRQPYSFIAEELKRSERRYRNVYEIVSVGIVDLDLDLRIQDMNPAASDILGYTRSEALGRQLTEYVDLEDCAWVINGLQTLVDGTAELQRSDGVIRNGAGQRVSVIVNASLDRDENGQPDRVLLSLADITELKKVEAERSALLVQVQAQANRLARILDTLPAGVVLIAADGEVLLTNPEADTALGLLAKHDASGRILRLGELPLASFLVPRSTSRQEIRNADLIIEATARPITDDVQPDQYVVILSDVTEARRARAEQAQQARLAAVGQLAAGIAHDFNNILASIMLYAQMDAGAPDVSERGRAHAQIITRESKRAAELVQQILDFGRRSVLSRGSVDMVQLVEEQVALLRRTLPENILIGTSLAEGPLTVKVDASRMQQIIMNLATNARDAMSEGGQLRIVLRRHHYSSHQLVPLPEMTPGDWIELSISDTGVGMTEEALSHAFEPFFTTKPQGKGTGLGLAQVYGIVEQHQGHIRIESKVGEGTQITVYLPYNDADHAIDADAQPDGPPQGDRETILIVEDSAAVRSALAAAMESLNYQVIEVENGQDALNILGVGSRSDAAGGEAQPSQIDVIVSDMMMPVMSGQALFETLQNHSCPVPLIIMSGYPTDERLRRLESQGLVGWLPKPVNLDDLARLLDDVLHQGT